jgi:putative transposase
MLKTLKLRLYPTQEQERLFHEAVGASKFTYNYVIRTQQANYAIGNKFITYYDLKKQFNQYKQTVPFLLACSSETLIGALRDAFTAYDNFFDTKQKKRSGYPKFRGRFDKKFYTRYDRLKAGINLDSEKDKATISRALKGQSSDYDISKRVRLDRIGWVKVAEPERLRGHTKFQNPRVKYDGKHWNLTVSVEFEPEEVQHTDEVVGIDLGIKDLAIASNGRVYKNINKSVKMRKLEKRKKRLQRQSSRKYQAQRVKGTAVVKGERFKKSNNQRKLEKRIAAISKKQSNIRRTYIQQVVADIVKTHPRAIVMESLNTAGLMKNHKLARSIQEQNWRYFTEHTRWKCLQTQTDFIQAGRFYASSKTCNVCGNVKHNLTLRDRVYTCEECGHVEDRDLNASHNLRDYGKNLLPNAA